MKNLTFEYCIVLINSVSLQRELLAIQTYKLPNPIIGTKKNIHKEYLFSLVKGCLP